jgi:hypothetical protein
MSKWMPLSSAHHAAKHYLPRAGYTFATEKTAIPIVTAEISRLLPHYALAFIHQDITYKPVAITGLRKQSFYLSTGGKWLVPYVPAFLRSYPFCLIPSNNQLIMCIQEDYLSDDEGDPLFDSNANLTKPVQDKLNFLNQFEKNSKLTHVNCVSLHQAGVFEKWPLQIKQPTDQNPVAVDGLYKISEKALNRLDKETFADLRGNGALALAYAQLFSMNQVSRLAELAKYHAQQQQKEQEPDIEQLFGEDAILSFDNI